MTRLVVETSEGFFGLLPHRLDCVAALVPGILGYHRTAHDEVFVAVDEGVLVKTGSAVVVSVRRALRGQDLARLRDAVMQQYLAVDEHEKSLRAAMARVESGFLHRFAGFERE
ncbi:MAG: F0F1 ATP synthase subunit epsilon [Betaproteobacteria bacterium]